MADVSQAHLNRYGFIPSMLILLNLRDKSPAQTIINQFFEIQTKLL